MSLCLAMIYTPGYMHVTPPHHHAYSSPEGSSRSSGSSFHTLRAMRESFLSLFLRPDGVRVEKDR
jgi:hypothetical protein